MYNAESYKKYIKDNPWYKHLKSARKRCNNIKNSSYEWYGGLGIKCLLILKEVKELWFRDKAYLMKRPSIDRIKSDKDYTFDNCRFIELSKNVEERNIRRSSKAVVQYDLQGNFIREWSSMHEAGRILKIHYEGISMVCRNIKKTAYNSIWKYKN